MGWEVRQGRRGLLVDDIMAITTCISDAVVLLCLELSVVATSMDVSRLTKLSYSR